MKKKEQELLFEVQFGSESLSVWSVTNNDGHSSFSIKGKDHNGILFIIKTGRLNTFSDALDALGRYPWQEFYPSFVHQDFINTIITAVDKLGGKKALESWQEILKRSK